jgi:hypothetical protein
MIAKIGWSSIKLHIGIVFKVLLNKFCCVSLVIHSATSVYLGLKTFCQYNDFQTEMHKTVSGC